MLEEAEVVVEEAAEEVVGEKTLECKGDDDVEDLSAPSLSETPTVSATNLDRNFEYSK